MKKYRLVLTEGDSFEVNKLHSIETDNLLQLLSQFSILLFKLQRELYESEIEEINLRNDDIPF